MSEHSREYLNSCRENAFFNIEVITLAYGAQSDNYNNDLHVPRAITTSSVSDPHRFFCGSGSYKKTKCGSGFGSRIHALTK
jgi:hypothetical protein